MNKSAKLIYPPIPLLLLGIASIVLLQQPNPFLFSTAFSPPPPLLLPVPPLLLTSTTTAPILGILGSLLFKPRNIKIVKSSTYPSGTTRFNKEDDEKDILTKAGIFFVDAFWAGKIGGAATLSTTQANTLERQQIQEFKKRYGSSSTSFSSRSSGSSSSSSSLGSGSVNRLPGRYADKLIPTFDARAELVLCVNSKGECLGCAGVEVEKIKKMDGYDGTISAPLMSNLAISKQYRRRGLAEELVKSTELIARKEWGYNECYLYVEKRNVPAIKLYTKLGYKPIWEDDNATTLVPSVDGRGVVNGKTTIVCMKKKLGGGIFG